jgi:hypothetical protein
LLYARTGGGPALVLVHGSTADPTIPAGRLSSQVFARLVTEFLMESSGN